MLIVYDGFTCMYTKKDVENYILRMPLSELFGESKCGAQVK